MKVAVTGGAGFLGRAVAQALAKNDIETLILDTSIRLASLKKDGHSYSTKKLEYPKVQGAEALFKGIDVVIHLACTTEPAISMRSMVYDAETNIIPSLEVFKAAENAGVRRVVFASSGGTVYGHPKTLPVTEDHPTHPICAYGASKLAIENYLALHDQIEGISLRIGNPYGNFQLRGATIGLIAKFLNAIRIDRPIEVWGDGSIVRDYLYIDDLGNAFLRAVTSVFVESGPYNIGSGMGKSIKDIIGKIFLLTDKAVPVNYIESRDFDVQGIVLDSSKFKMQTGWGIDTNLDMGILELWKNLLVK